LIFLGHVTTPKLEKYMTAGISTTVGDIDLDKVVTHCKDAQEAQLNAFNSSVPGSHVYPVIGYRHGRRLHLSFPASAGAILEIGDIKSATKAENQKNIDLVWNRKPDMNHVSAVAEYVAESVNSDRKYILPNTIIAGFHGVTAHVWESRGTYMGYIVIAPGAKLPVTDGQHRHLALAKIRHDSPDDTWLRVENEQYLVTLTLEQDIKQAHQDFVDVGKTRPIEASVLKTWDQKDPHSRITKSIGEQSPLFHERVDVMSNSLGRTTDIVLTMSQLNLVTAELLYGSAQRPRVSVGSRPLKREIVFDTVLQRALDFFKFFAENNDEWRQCVVQDANPDFFKLRQDRLDFNSTGLQAICRAAHYILTDGNLTGASRDELIRKLASLDYNRRDVERNINIETPFHGNVLSSDGGILNKRATVDAGTVALLNRIGYGESHRAARSNSITPLVAPPTELDADASGSEFEA
jgi:DNA sulfur modification protein DndB